LTFINELNILEFLWLGSGGIVCIIWAIQQYIENQKKVSFVWSIILFSTGFWLLSGSFFFTGLFRLFPYFSVIHIPMVFLSATFLYEYLKFVFLEIKIQFRLLHFFPFIVSILLIIPYFTLSKAEMVSLFLPTNNAIYPSIIRILNLSLKLSIFVSVGLFLFKDWLPNVKLRLFLQKNAIYTLAFVILIWLDLIIGIFGFFLQREELKKISAYLLPLIMYFYFFTRSLWSPFLFDLKENIQKNKYQKTKLAGIDLKSIEYKLQKLMEEKIFCDEDLSLSDLAILVGIKQGQLSEYFQKQYGYGFYHYINKFRIEEAKILLGESSHRSVLSIADSVGFNSKSTFNRVFLDLVGKTPSEYKIQFSHKQ